MQIKTLEQAAKQHRSTKQALTKKQRLSKKNGEEFSQVDVQKLNLVNKQHQDTQQQLDEVLNEFYSSITRKPSVLHETTCV